jgi:hypothetical protein
LENHSSKQARFLCSPVLSDEDRVPKFFAPIPGGWHTHSQSSDTTLCVQPAQGRDLFRGTKEEQFIFRKEEGREPCLMATFQLALAIAETKRPMAQYGAFNFGV